MFNPEGTIFNRKHDLGKKVPDEKIILAADVFKTFKKVPLNKLSEGLGINLTKNGRKDIIKVVRIQRNFTEKARKDTSEEVGLPLIKNVLTPLTKSIVVPLGLTATDPAI